MMSGTDKTRRNCDEESTKPSWPGGSKVLRRLGRSKKLKGLGRIKKQRRQERSKETGLGGGVLGNLPRAGAEPKNPGKRGSLSPQVMEGCSAGQIFLLWCTISLILPSFMSMWLKQVTSRDQQQKYMDLEVQESGINEAKPKCGVG